MNAPVWQAWPNPDLFTVKPGTLINLDLPVTATDADGDTVWYTAQLGSMIAGNFVSIPGSWSVGLQASATTAGNLVGQLVVPAETPAAAYVLRLTASDGPHWTTLDVNFEVVEPFTIAPNTDGTVTLSFHPLDTTVGTNTFAPSSGLAYELVPGNTQAGSTWFSALRDPADPGKEMALPMVAGVTDVTWTGTPIANADSARIRITGTGGSDTLVGTAGNDTLMGLAGNDTYVMVEGQSGSDEINDAGPANVASAGTDTLVVAAAAGVHTSFEMHENHPTTSLVVKTLAPNDMEIGRVAITNQFTADSSGNVTGPGNGAIEQVVLGLTGFTYNVVAGATGTSGNDLLAGTNQFFGPNGPVAKSGEDTLTGGAGTDALYGAGGNDVLDGGEGVDVLAGGQGDDTIISGAGGDFIDGNSGMDSLSFANDPDSDHNGVGVVVNLTPSPQSGSWSGYAYSIAASSALDGWGSTDTLSGIENLRGSVYADVLFGGGGHGGGGGTINGGGGGDLLLGSGGNTLDGGMAGRDKDIDWVAYSGNSTSIDINLGAGWAWYGMNGGDTLLNIDGVLGSAFGDRLMGGSNSRWFNGTKIEWFMGNAGNDTIDGGRSDNGAAMNAGNFELNVARYDSATAGVTVNLGTTGTASDGLGGTDTLIGINYAWGSSFADTLNGGNALFDYAEMFEGAGGSDSISGGTGFDWAGYRSATAGVAVNLATGTASDGLGGTDTLVSIEGVVGSDFNDTITGSAGDEVFQGRKGADVIDGSSGIDEVRYSSDYEANGDKFGVAVNLSAVQVTENLSGWNFVLAAGTALDGWGTTDTLSNIENAHGSIYADAIFGSSADNYLRGDEGGDLLAGGAGNDTLDGGRGSDTVMLAGANATGWVFSRDTADPTKVNAIKGTESDVLIGVESVRFADDANATNYSLAALLGEPVGAPLAINFAGGPVDPVPAGERFLDLSYVDARVSDAGYKASLVEAGGFVTHLYDTDADGLPDTGWGYQTGSTFPSEVGTLEFVDSDFSHAGFEGFVYTSGAAAQGRLAFDVNGKLVGFYAPVDPSGGGIDGTPGADVLTGEGGWDRIVAGAGNDTISAGAGNDSIEGGAGDDVIDGGDHHDTGVYAGNVAYFNVTRNVDNSLTVKDNIGIEGTDALTNVESLQFAGEWANLTLGYWATPSFDYWARNSVNGTVFDEVIDADALDDANSAHTYSDWIDAAGGNDLILAGKGGDEIRGGAGNDTIDGGVLTEVLPDPAVNIWEIQNHVRYSGSYFGYELTRNTDNGAGAITGTGGGIYYTVKDLRSGALDGTDTVFNVDTLEFSDRSVNLATAFSATQSLEPWAQNNVNGTVFGDVIDADALHDANSALTYRDSINAGYGDDLILAGKGGDWIESGAGDDTIDGGVVTENRLDPAVRLWEIENHVRYNASFSSYAITQNIDDAAGAITGVAAGVYYTVTDLRSGLPDGTDTLFNVDTLEFNDRQFPLTPQYWVQQDQVWVPNDSTPDDPSDGTWEQVVRGLGINGGMFADVIDADALAGTGAVAFRDWINGGGGNDLILAGKGGDQIDGGAGDDTIDGGVVTENRLDPTVNTWDIENHARYSGLSSRYKILQNIDDNAGTVTGVAAGVYYTVEDLRGGSPDGTDTLFNVDTLDFSDKQVRLTAQHYVQTQQIWTPDETTPALDDGTWEQVVRGMGVTGGMFADSVGALPGDTEAATAFAGSDRLEGREGDDTLYGGAGADTLRGDKGNDSLVGGAGRQSTDTSTGDWNGASGDDVAEYSGDAGRYSIAFKNANGSDADGFVADGTVIVSDSKGAKGDGTDTLSGIEVLRFADGQKNLTVVSSVWYNSVYDPSANGGLGGWVQTTVVGGINWNGSDWIDVIDASNSTLMKDYVTAGAGDDSISTGDDADRIQPGEGNDLVDGGADGTSTEPWANSDVVILDASRRRFDIDMSEDATSGLRTFTVRDKLADEFGGLGTDTITNVERLEFSEGVQTVLQVRFDKSGAGFGARNGIEGTDFGDIITADDLFAAAAGTDRVMVGAEIALSVTAEGFTPAAGSHYLAVAGTMTNYYGTVQFTPLYDNNQVSQLVKIDLTAQSDGTLTGLYKPSQAGTLVFQIFDTPAQGVEFDYSTAQTLGQAAGFTVYTMSDHIRAGAGDDVVYAGAGGDYMQDSAGNDYYDGDGDGTSAYSWQNQDTVQFAGAQRRYTVDVLAAADAPTSIQKLITDDYGSLAAGPANVVRVSDKLPAISGGEGVNYIINVEQLGFQDGGVSLGVTEGRWQPQSTWGQNGDTWVGSNNYNGGILNDTMDATGHDVVGTLSATGGVWTSSTGWFSNRDWMDGGAGNDTLIGGAGGDDLRGGKGNDLLYGGDNGTSSNQWDNLDRANFSNSINRYDIQFFSVVAVGTGTHDSMGMESLAGDYVLSGYYDPAGITVIEDRYSDAMGGEGRDVLTGIEQINFSDAWETLAVQYNDNPRWSDTNSNGIMDQSEITGWNRSAWGTRFGDRIEGAPDKYNDLNGAGGNDYIIGSNLQDNLSGGAGNDTIDGGGNPAVDPARPWETWNIYDMAGFAAERKEFKIEQLTDLDGTVTGDPGNFYYRVEHLIPVKLGGLGTDIVFDVERMNFWSGDVPLLVKVDQWGNSAEYTGTMFGDTITGTSMDERFFGNAGNDSISAGDGNDQISLGVGNDSADGGADIDNVTYADGHNRYTVTNSGNGAWTVVDTLAAQYGGEGTDTLTNVETLNFTDGTFTTGVSLFNSTASAPTNDTLDGTSYQNNFASADYTVTLEDLAGNPLATYDTVTNTFKDAGGVLVVFAPNDHQVVATDSNGYRYVYPNAVSWALDGSSIQITVASGDLLQGWGGNDTLNGLAGDDNLDGGAGNDILNGGTDSTASRSNYWGAGDTARYQDAPRDRFDIIANGNGSYTVADLASLKDLNLTGADRLATTNVWADVGYGVDTLSGIERVQFNDVTLDLVPIKQSWTWTSSYWNGRENVAYEVTRGNITGTFQDDLLLGSVYGDQIDGRGGNDIINGRDENLTVGNIWEIQDVVNYSGTRERYEIKGVLVDIAGDGSDRTEYTIVAQDQANGNELFGIQITDTLADIPGNTGTDLLVNVERVQFAWTGSGDNSINIKPELNYYDDWSAPLNPDGSRPKALSARGTIFDDVLAGKEYSDWLSGNEGNDTLLGGAGGDDMEGGKGDDLLIGGANAAVNEWGWARTDTGRFNAGFDRFEVTSVQYDMDGVAATTDDVVTAMQVRDLLPSDDASSLGTDILIGVESLSFNDRWVDVSVRRWEWTDWQGAANTNAEGTTFNDVIEGDRIADGTVAANPTRDYLRGNAGNDVLIGGGNGDNLTGGEGHDVLDGGANGASGNAWQDQDTASFMGNGNSYVIQAIAIDSGKIFAEGVQIARFDASTLTMTAPDLAEGVGAVLQSAYNYYKYDGLTDGNHNAGYLVVDTLGADLGGGGANLVFNVESFGFADGSRDLEIRAWAGDWNNDGILDNVWTSGTAGADTVTMAKLASLTNKTVEDLQAVSMNTELREGDDIYIGGDGGEWIRPGAGNDYIDGGANAGINQWGGPVRDDVSFGGKSSRYTVMDVLLNKSGDAWTLSSSRNADMTLADRTLTDPTATAELVAGMQQGVLNMIDHAVAADANVAQIKGWLVADRLPAEFEGTGVDALVNVEGLSFNDKWLPLEMQVYYNREWILDPVTGQYQQGTAIIGANVEGTSDDDLITGAGNVTYDFRSNDGLNGNAGDDTIDGGAGGDWIRGGAGDDIIDGGANGGVDQWGNTQSDIAQYTGPYERYAITQNADGSVSVIDSDSESDGDGSDTLINVEALSFTDRWVRLGIDTHTWTDPQGRITGVNVNGSMMGDLIDVSADAYTGVQHHLQGNEGDDTLIGGEGPDQFSGGIGADEFVGGANGVDPWGNPGFDFAWYDGMSDRYTIEIVEPDTDDREGNSFNDQTFSINGVTYTVVGDPDSGGTATGSIQVDGQVVDVNIVRVTDSMSDEDGGNGVDLMIGIENIGFWDHWITLAVAQSFTDIDGDGTADAGNLIGTREADTLTGSDLDDLIGGGGGNDTLSGGKGGDILVGGAGDDAIDGGENGIDAKGNASVDIALYDGDSSDYDIARKEDGSYRVRSTADGTDTLVGVEGLQFDDVYVTLDIITQERDLNADGVTDVIKVTGLDVIGDLLDYSDNTNAGLDYHLYGGGGDDSLRGGAGDDILMGGEGSDGLAGGAGEDWARYEGKHADYGVTDTGAGTWTVTKGSETDTLTGIEGLRFDDKEILDAVTNVTFVDVDTDGNKKVDQRVWTGTDGADIIPPGTASLVATMTNVMKAGDGNDTLSGGALADVFAPGNGSDSIDGGGNKGLSGDGSAAKDVVIFSGNRSDYIVKTVQQSTFSFSGEVDAGDIYTVTAGSNTFTYMAQTGDDLADIAASFKSQIENPTTGITGVTVSYGDGDSIPEQVDITVGSATTPDKIAVTLRAVDQHLGVAASVANGVHAADGTFTVSGANQTGSSLIFADSNTTDAITIEAGMSVAYQVTTGTGNSAVVTNYGPYRVESVNGTTLQLDQSLGTSPANDAALVVTESNDDTSGAASDATYDRWTEIGTLDASTTGVTDDVTETDVLRNIEEVVFGDRALSINPVQTTSATWVAGTLETTTKVTGTALADLMWSTNATEVFKGGAGADHFIVGDASGDDMISDFSAGAGGDVITLYLGASDTDGINGTGVDTVAELMARASDEGGDTRIDLGLGYSLLLADVDVATLIAANFEVVTTY